jgi:hypothetical protein
MIVGGSGRNPGMIRNVVVGRVRAGVARETVEEALAAIAALDPPGCRDMKVGVDAGLREGNWSFSITADFADEDAYRRYDLEDEHNRVRRELFAPICEDIVRVQFRA